MIKILVVLFCSSSISTIFAQQAAKVDDVVPFQMPKLPIVRQSPAVEYNYTPSPAVEYNYTPSPEPIAEKNLSLAALPTFYNTTSTYVKIKTSVDNVTWQSYLMSPFEEAFSAKTAKDKYATKKLFVIIITEDIYGVETNKRFYQIEDGRPYGLHFNYLFDTFELFYLAEVL